MFSPQCVAHHESMRFPNSPKRKFFVDLQSPFCFFFFPLFLGSGNSQKVFPTADFHHIVIKVLLLLIFLVVFSCSVILCLGNLYTIYILQYVPDILIVLVVLIMMT